MDIQYVYMLHLLVTGLSAAGGRKVL